MSGKIKLVSVALALARVTVPAMAADMPGVTPTEIKIGGDLSLQRPRLVDRPRRPRNSRLRAIRQRPRRASTAARSTISRRRRLQPAKGGRAYPQACRRRRGRFHVQPARARRKFGDGKIPGRQESAGRSPSSPARTSSPMSRTYPLTTTGLVSFDTEGKIYAKYLTRIASEREIRDPLPERRPRQGLRQRLQGACSRAISTRRSWLPPAMRSPTRRWTRRSST